MATETLHFENARLAQQLYNNDPRNLQALDHQLGVKATSREGWIKLEGDTDDLERAKHLFLLLENSLKAGTPVRSREFSHALNIVKHEGVSTLKDILTDRIQTSEKKPSVTAKTVGQKHYLDAIRNHDVTIGVGPAGTGKTDRKSTRLNSSHSSISYAVFCLKKKKKHSKYNQNYHQLAPSTAMPAPPGARCSP